MSNLPKELTAKRDAIHRESLAREISEYVRWIANAAETQSYIGDGYRAFLSTLSEVASNAEKLNKQAKPGADGAPIVRAVHNSSWHSVFEDVEAA